MPGVSQNGTSRTQPLANERGAGIVRVGPAGWSYDDWKGVVYPQPMPNKMHPLELLSQWFDTIEINSSFYRPMQARFADRWIQAVAGNPQFRFTAKLWRRFTHENTDALDSGDVAAFNDGARPLDESGLLGALLIQFPWSFKRTPGNRRWLETLTGAFEQYPLVVEVRHNSWNRQEVFDGLAARGIALCNIDQPLFRDSIGPDERVTAPLAYVRLHGRNYDDWFREDADRDERYDYLYSPEELAPWIDRLRAIRNKAGEVYAVTNNHYRGQAVVNALEIQAALGGRNVSIPGHLLEHYPRLAELAHRDTVS